MNGVEASVMNPLVIVKAVVLKVVGAGSSRVLVDTSSNKGCETRVWGHVDLEQLVGVSEVIGSALLAVLFVVASSTALPVNHGRVAVAGREDLLGGGVLVWIGYCSRTSKRVPIMFDLRGALIRIRKGFPFVLASNVLRWHDVSSVKSRDKGDKQGRSSRNTVSRTVKDPREETIDENNRQKHWTGTGRNNTFNLNLLCADRKSG